MAGQYDNKQGVGIGTGLLLLGGMAAMMFAALWFVKHDLVVRGLLRYAYALDYIPAWICIKSGFLGAPPVTLIREIAAMSFHPGKVNLGMLLTAVNRASIALLPFIGIIGFMAWRVHGHVLRNLETMHDYWSLMRIQSLTNPCIVPVVRFTEYWREKGLDRHVNLFRAITPDEFAEKHGLIRQSGNDLLIDYDKTVKTFEEQLGAVISDASKLPAHYRALAAIFMTRIVYRGEEGRRNGKAMLDAINLSCDPNKTGNGQDADCRPAFDFASVAGDFDELFKHPDIVPIRTYFIHEKTFLMRLLNEARWDGKLPPSEFVWLKLIDRPLWYALYGVSKNLIAKGYSEGGAAFGQYWAAQAAMQHEQVLCEPHMDEVVRGFEKRLFEANMVSERLYMTDKEREREREFGRIPDI